MHSWPALILMLLTASSVYAWNKPGHQIIGAIAYDVIKTEHPQAIAGVLQILKQHPEYDAFFAKEG